MRATTDAIMKRLLALLPLAALALAACGTESDAVSVADQWARASAAGQTSGAVYFDLTVADDDVLLGVEVPDSVAARAEVHEVVAAETDAQIDPETDDSADEAGSEDMGDMADESHEMGEMDGDRGAMTMQQVTSLALVGGETLSFEPGSYHVMLFDLADPLEVGDELDLTLDLEQAGTVTVAVTVSDEAP